MTPQSTFHWLNRKTNKQTSTLVGKQTLVSLPSSPDPEPEPSSSPSSSSGGKLPEVLPSRYRSSAAKVCAETWKTEDSHSYHSSIKDRKKRASEQSSFITLPEFFPLIKSMWMSPQLRGKTIPLTSSDLSRPSMRSLQFKWAVYRIHTVTFIVNWPRVLF